MVGFGKIFVFIVSALFAFYSVNDVHVLDLRTADWQRVVIPGEKPYPRFGQSQIFIDDTHLLILGLINFSE